MDSSPAAHTKDTSYFYLVIQYVAMEFIAVIELNGLASIVNCEITRVIELDDGKSLTGSPY